MSTPLSILDIVPKEPKRRTAWVQYQLKVRGLSFASIAADLDCSRRAVALAMQVPSYRQEQAIADALDIDVKILFPERYDPRTGERLHRIRVAVDDTAGVTPSRNVEKRRRA